MNKWNSGGRNEEIKTLDTMRPQQILVELQWATYVDPQSILPYFTDKVLFFFCSVCLCTIKRKLINTNGKIVLIFDVMYI